MPGVARGMSSNRFGNFFFVRLQPLLPSFPSSPSHLKLVTNRIGFLDFLMVPYGYFRQGRLKVWTSDLRAFFLNLNPARKSKNGSNII